MDELRRTARELAQVRKTNSELAKLCDDQRLTMKEGRERWFMLGDSLARKHGNSLGPNETWQLAGAAALQSREDSQEGRSEPLVHRFHDLSKALCGVRWTKERDQYFTAQTCGVTCPECRAKMGGKA